MSLNYLYRKIFTKFYENLTHYKVLKALKAQKKHFIYFISHFNLFPFRDKSMLHKSRKKPIIFLKFM